MALTTKLSQTPIPLMLYRFSRLQMSSLWRRTGRALGVRRPVPLTLDELQVPDSALATKATELARGCESETLFNHSVRTYLFGLAVGNHLNLRVDRELVYLAAILHDIGLTSEYDTDGPFELNSARAAHEFLLAENTPAERADMVHEAIALHTSSGVADSREPEIALVHFGAGFDVVGLRRADVAKETRTTVLGAWPRIKFKEEFGRLMKDQATRKPDCHVARQYKMGFKQMIARAPFSE